MKTHYTAKELAGLPGMPGTERSVQRTADRENWPWRKRAGRGGGKEYLLAALPLVTQAALMPTSSLPVVSKPAPLPVVAATIQPAKAPEQLKQWQRSIMDARVAIMRL
ncbi:MAG: DNA-binding protein, partial [Desulfuromonadaceae bacterium]|nr:DNA-binding protein [Desulfuromonadaceae bacterium]